MVERTVKDRKNTCKKKLIIENKPLPAFGIPAFIFFIASGIYALYVILAMYLDT